MIMSVLAFVMLISFIVWMWVLAYKEFRSSDINRDVKYKYDTNTKYRGPEDEPEWEKYRRQTRS